MSAQSLIRRPLCIVKVAVPILMVAALLAVPTDGADARGKTSRVWRSAAKRLRTAAKSDAKGAYFLALARAQVITDEEARDEAIDDAVEEYREERALANDQYRARLALADDLEETSFYHADIDPSDFVTVIDNPWLPLPPGTTRTYQAETEDGTETIVVTVLHETKEILGVTCVVVRDTVSIDGELVEDTHDWFAQDKGGNVWYFGEIALNYEDGDISDVDGSWIGGVDGAQPGIVMPADPQVGMLYRQEFYLGDAEDFAEVLSIGATATVPFGAFTNCIETFDGTPMEPDVEEHKFYARGVGVVLEVTPETGERVELIEVTTADE